MKTFIITTALSLLFITSSDAGNGNGIDNTISKKLKIPAELKDQKLNEKVNVQFKINNNGETILLDVKTSNKDLKKYVEKEFPKLDLRNSISNKETIYFIDLNFKVL